MTDSRRTRGTRKSADRKHSRLDPFFEEMANFYDCRQKASVFGERQELFLEAGREVLRNSRNDRQLCLDLGCGPGAISVALAQLGFEVIGVDGSKAMVELANAAAAQAGSSVASRCSFVCDDLSDFLARSARQADYILSSSVFEYLPEPETVLELVSRRLTASGRFAVSIPNRHSLPRRLERLDLLRLPKDQRYTSHWRNSMDERAMIEEGRRLGFVSVHTSYFGTLAPRGRPVLRRWATHRRIGTLTMIVFTAAPGGLGAVA